MASPDNNHGSLMRKFIRSKTVSESSESSSIGPEVDVNFAEMEAPRNRAGSITCKDDVRADGKDQKMENVLYDKYLAK